MNRRDFVAGLAVVPLAVSVQQAAAASDPVEGKDYLELRPPQPLAVPGKIEVIEFFGYWCPHCNAFEGRIEPWIKAQAKDVNVRRIPVAWQDAQLPYQKLYFALESMGVSNEVHPRVFNAYHEQHLRLDEGAPTVAFAKAIGVDPGKLVEALKGFTVATKVNLAKQAVSSYQIEGVPTLVVDGRYLTSPEMAEGEEGSLRVVDALVKKVRAGGVGKRKS